MDLAQGQAIAHGRHPVLIPIFDDVRRVKQLEMPERADGALTLIGAHDDRAKDPLVQALTLTAIVITFGVTALLLSLIYRVYIAHSTLDTDTLAKAEEAEEQSAEQDAGADDPEDDAAALLEEGKAA